MGFKINGKVELKNGDKVTLRNGDVLIYDEYYDKIVNTEDSRCNYDEDLKHTHNEELDIVEVERADRYQTIYNRIEDDEDEKYEDGTEAVNELLKQCISDLPKGAKITIEL